MFKRVRRGVSQETQNKQTTWENSSLSGDFCFVNCPEDDSISQAEMQRLQEQNRILDDNLKTLQQQRQAADQANTEKTAQQHEAEQQLQALLQQNRDLQAKLKNQQQSAAQRQDQTSAMQQLQEQNRLLEARLKAVQQERQTANQSDQEKAKQQQAAEQQLQTLLQQNRDLQTKLKIQEQVSAQYQEVPVVLPKSSAAPEHQEPVKQRGAELPPAL
jgi:chromosome segregation ATPase